MREGRVGDFEESSEDDEAILLRIKARLKKYGRKEEDEGDVTGVALYALQPETFAFSK